MNIADTIATRPQTLIALVFATALATIAGAWGFELMGYLPCPLCLKQRLPYYAVMPLSLIALWLYRMGRGGASAAVMIACAALMIFGAGLGAYHAGVEWHFWQGPTSCAAGGGFDPAKGVLPDLSAGQFISCTEAAIRIFGISLAGYNALIAPVLAALSLLAARRSI